MLKTKHDSYEIIVVDNNSTDGSQTWIKNTYPQIRLIENDKNYGYAGGCNRGALDANGDYLVFLNNDTIQDPDWIKHLEIIMEKEKKLLQFNLKFLIITITTFSIMLEDQVGIWIYLVSHLQGEEFFRGKRKMLVNTMIQNSASGPLVLLFL